jgi:hypothetical protein
VKKSTPVEENDFIDTLPDELLLRVFSFLRETDLFRTSEVSRRWNRLSFDLKLWETKSKYWHSTQNIVSKEQSSIFNLYHFD